MPSSRAGAARRLACASLLLALAGAAGCARAPRERPVPPEPVSEASADLPERRAPDEGEAGRAEGAPEREARGGREARGESAPARLDPSEEITPEELATIPEPVRGGPAPAPGRPGEATPSEASSGTMEPGPVAEAPSGDSEAPAGREGAWSVQVYASESRAEAERVARAASARLGAEAAIEREGALYKVRLGRFASEAGAQALRERALREGYPGAFRTRLRP